MDIPNRTKVEQRRKSSVYDAADYSVPAAASQVFQTAIISNHLIANDLPPEIRECSGKIRFIGSEEPSLPVNWRFAEAVSSLKALEAALVNVMLKRKYKTSPQEVVIDTDHATLFIMSAILGSIDPGGENITAGSLRSGDKALLNYFPSFDKYGAGASLHRELATNIYKCSDGRYFHTHGSLNPDPVLETLGVPPHSDETAYESAVQPFLTAASKIGSDDLQRRTDETKQAGTICYTVGEFNASDHGKANAHVGLWQIHDRSISYQPPSWWPDDPQTGPSRPLAGLKVVDLTRIIAAPTVTRSLAELGASVMRCTSPNLPDIGSLHADLNWGKWNCSIDLHNSEDRDKLRALIMQADVVVQGYRPGSLDKYGFGENDILGLCAHRGRGIIYVRENCYGWHGPWVNRSGWQQVADANTGVSYGYGRAMGIDEPVSPVFPHSDYCTGIAGSCAIILALLRRAEKGGSFTIDLALNHYSAWLVNHVGRYPPPVWEKAWTESGRPVFRHWHNNAYKVPEVMKKLRAGVGGKRLFKPEYFEDRPAPAAVGDKMMRRVKPVAQWQDVVRLGFNVGTRSNGVDAPEWPADLRTETVLAA